MMLAFNLRLLRHVCRLHGIQPSYISSEGKVVWASPESLLRILQDLTGQKINSDVELQGLLQKRHEKRLADGLEPIHVAWDGQSPSLQIYSSQKIEAAKLKAQIKTETGEILDLKLKILFQNQNKVICRWENKIPLGYHDLTLQTTQRTYKSWIIAPPPHLKDPGGLEHSWGPFFPVYALNSENDLGMGSLAEMRQGTLPLLAGNFDRPDCDPSPYSALTRLFWNEIYLDLEDSLQNYQFAEPQKIFASPEFRQETQRLRAQPYCDYYGVYQNKKQVLKKMAAEFFQSAGAKSQEFAAYNVQHPEISEYIHFRSQDPDEQRFHHFVQFEMDRQLQQFKSQTSIGLYLDFPVGVNDAGFDFHQFRDVFFAEVSVGAPPEQVFVNGQDWGFPSFHPENHRRTQYAYFRKSLQNHLKFSSILRLDHVMGLFRVFCVPKGLTATQGVYLRYPPEELFALAVLEASRAGADFVGENLGTVPVAVDHLMKKRNIKGMWVAQMQMEKPESDLTAAIPPSDMACFNTHDMPMFASFCRGTDLELVAKLGILSPELKKSFEIARQTFVSAWTKKMNPPLFESMLKQVAASPARYFVANMEDLWDEDQPQNIPGTFREYPNWRKKFRCANETWLQQDSTLRRLNILKKYRSPR
jgi:4-alpha-glucanotransferase